MFNFTIPFINWLKRAWQKIGPILPTEGGKVPLSRTALQDSKVLEVYGQDVAPVVVTDAVYKAYIAEWDSLWEQMYPGTPVPQPPA
jgi:hypothetical protein